MISVWGTFAFGLVLGWLVYYTNRYRTGEVGFQDLGTLVGVIAGGAVTRLFQYPNDPAAGVLFGAYGAGLATGFFLYFAMLIVFIAASKDISWSAFITGIPKTATGDPGRVIMFKTESDDKLARFQASDVSAGRLGERHVFAAGLAASLDEAVSGNRRILEIEPDLDVAVDSVGRAVTAIRKAMWADGISPQELAALRQALRLFTDQFVLLKRLKAAEIFLDKDIQEAAKRLSEITTNVKKESERFKVATERLEAATKAINSTLKLVSTISKLIPL